MIFASSTNILPAPSNHLSLSLKKFLNVLSFPDESAVFCLSRVRIYYLRVLTFGIWCLLLEIFPSHSTFSYAVSLFHLDPWSVCGTRVLSYWAALGSHRTSVLTFVLTAATYIVNRGYSHNMNLLDEVLQYEGYIERDTDTVLRNLSYCTPRNNVHIKVTPNNMAEEQHKLAREALTHIECYNRIGELTTRPICLGWRQDGRLVFMSENVPGRTIGEYIRTTPVDTPEIIKKTMQAIQTLWKVGIAHRDLHSANVMVYRDASNALQIKIIDFGYSIIRDMDISGEVYGPKFANTFQRSADVAIFMRSIALSFSNSPYHPFLNTYDTIMRAYERESSDRLAHMSKPDYWSVVPTFISDRDHTHALVKLYEEKREWRDCGHLDYYLSHFDWKTMYPENIIATISKYHV